MKCHSSNINNEKYDETYVLNHCITKPKRFCSTIAIHLIKKADEEGINLELLGEGNLSQSHFDASASSRCLEPGEVSQVSRREFEE